MHHMHHTPPRHQRPMLKLHHRFSGFLNHRPVLTETADVGARTHLIHLSICWYHKYTRHSAMEIRWEAIRGCLPIGPTYSDARKTCCHMYCSNFEMLTLSTQMCSSPPFTTVLDTSSVPSSIPRPHVMRESDGSPTITTPDVFVHCFRS